MFASPLTLGFRLKAEVYSALADEQLLTSDKIAGMHKLIAGSHTSWKPALLMNGNHLTFYAHMNIFKLLVP